MPRNARRPVRVLFDVRADADNVNAQSINAREIGLRLDPARFRAIYFAERPDPRLAGRAQVVRLPPRLRSLVIGAYLLWGRYDVLVYPPVDGMWRLRRALARVARRPAVLEVVEGAVDDLLERADAGRRRQVLASAEVVGAISPFIAERLRARLGRDSVPLPLGVDVERFRPDGTSTGDGPLHVLYVGSLQPAKRVDVLLDVARALHPGEATFTIAGAPLGDLAYGEALARGATDLPHVHLVGPRSQADLQRSFAEADVLVLPSRSEGTPRVTLEAAAAGVPSIVFADYRTPTVVDGVTGYQVTTEEELVARLRALGEDRALVARLGAGARRLAEERSWDAVAPTWAAAIEAADRQRRSPLQSPP